MNWLGELWRRLGRLGKTLIVVVVPVIALSIVGAITSGSDDGGSGDTNVATETTDTETTETATIGEVTPVEPLTCLEDAELSDMGGGSVFWFANHESPLYRVSVQLFPSEAESQQVVEDAVNVYAAQAGAYAVTGPAKVTTEGSQLSADEGAEADALVQEVATCLGG